MNFLPFVFTFLLLLTMITSFLFSSVLGTARANKMILSEHIAYIKLIAMQNKSLFKPKKTITSKEHKENTPQPPKADDPEPRSINEGLEKSKLNLFAMIHGNNPQMQQVSEKIALRLLEILYGSCSFYNKAEAKNIVHQMIVQKIESFEELELASEQMYYKMLKGTNTGYPALGEVFRICKEEPKPIYFRYATKPLLRAAVGETLANKVFDAEIKQWMQNKSKKVMLKKNFIELLKSEHSSLVPLGLVGKFFNFDWKNKGQRQVFQNKKEKIRALHQAEKTL
jgi:hypothetical protein